MHKTIFITGGASGIGRAVAVKFGQQGWFVGIADINEAGTRETAAMLPASKNSVHKLDVRDREAWDAALADCARRHGRLDILVNNAMAYTWGPIESMSSADWQANFATSVDGTFWGTRSALQLMKAHGGAIVNLSSICGTLGTAWMAGYSAAKAAVINFSRAAAAEGAAHGIRVNVVIPAVVETPATAGMLSDPAAKASTEKLIPLGRVGQARELANAILFLASDEASYVTGAALPVDGGRSAVLVTAL